MQQNQQRRVQTTQLYYCVAENTKPIPAETGKHLKYDMKEVRAPGRLAEEYQKRQEQNKDKMRANMIGENGATVKKQWGDFGPRHIHL